MNLNDKSRLENFLTHYIIVIKEQLDDIVSSEKPMSEFESGRKQGYYEIVDLILECAHQFSIPLIDLGMENFGPDNHIETTDD